ncbi:hypothetical protein J007_01112 [Cryptococcus neoformans]|nr:hypothetical protein J007_01112 [Cryptococcus neoformans var. grubii]OXC63996.1 hypothetical protein C358_01112 [Cryptococcus neoformans var. grubii MW-RSA852]
MPIHPHIHCFLPSSSPHINLEARLYLPLTDNHAIPLTTQLATYTSPPVYYDKLDVETVGAIREMGIERLITAAHPWGRMGGNMLDPVLCHLVSATFTPAETTDRALISPLLPPPKTAILTYNVRGVGCSQGSQPWLGIGSDPADLSKVETVVSDLLGNLKQVMRFGYSWGSLLVALASPHPLLRHILIISPPCKIFAGITFFSSRSFRMALSDLLKSGVDVTMIYGTKDEFTSVDTFRAFGNDLAAVTMLRNSGSMTIKDGGTFEKLEIEEADHLYRRANGEMLREKVGEWLGWAIHP